MHALALILALAGVTVAPHLGSVSCGDRPRTLRSATLVSADGERRAHVEVDSATVTAGTETDYPFDGREICANTATLWVADGKGQPFRLVYVQEPERGLEEANLMLADWSADGRYLLFASSQVGLVGCVVVEQHPYLWDTRLRSLIVPGEAILEEARTASKCSELTIEPLGFSPEGAAVVEVTRSAVFDDEECRPGSEQWSFGAEVGSLLVRRESKAAIRPNGRVVK